ncbi:MAG TPA: pilus assembly PilX N-terminal domain-containing protein, partial [Tepidisphaeraceae bacterium]|nr:pilus assembly PilX N-terminal domain-containing protein [Tepidisphaeraceae bacterium]
MASLLAMLYLVIFSALAVGFYAQTTLSAQVTANERTQHRAQLAAESGVRFTRHLLSKLEVRYCPEPDLMNAIHTQLYDLMADSGNLEFGLQEVGLVDMGTKIVIPKDPYAIINLGEKDYGFRAEIVRNGRQLVVTVAGYGGRASRGLGRGIEYTYTPDEIPAPVLQQFGVASNGQVSVAGNGLLKGNPTAAHGSLYITTNLNPVLTMTGPSEITGDVYIKNPAATTSIAAGCMIGGTSDPVERAKHIHKPWPAPWTDPTKPPPPEPEMPVIDTAIFLPYVTANYSAAMGNKIKNVRILAGTNPTFASGAVLEGVIFVESPNKLSFAGDCVIRGLIVGQNPTTLDAANLANNVITFSGQVTAHDAGTLDPAVYGDITKFTGTSLVVPRHNVMFSGGYAAISGSICSHKLTFSGKAGGNIQGTIFGVGNQILSISGSSEVWISRPPTPKWPAGMFFRSRWIPATNTYR